MALRIGFGAGQDPSIIPGTSRYKKSLCFFILLFDLAVQLGRVGLLWLQRTNVEKDPLLPALLFTIPLQLVLKWVGHLTFH